MLTRTKTGCLPAQRKLNHPSEVRYGSSLRTPDSGIVVKEIVVPSSKGSTVKKITPSTAPQRGLRDIKQEVPDPTYEVQAALPPQDVEGRRGVKKSKISLDIGNAPLDVQQFRVGDQLLNYRGCNQVSRNGISLKECISSPALKQLRKVNSGSSTPVRCSLPAPNQGPHSGISVAKKPSPIYGKSLERKGSSDLFLPLQGYVVVLDMDNLVNKIEMLDLVAKLGGTVQEFVTENPVPYLIVSDHTTAILLQKYKTQSFNTLDKQVVSSLPSMLKLAVRLKVRVRYFETFRENSADSYRKFLSFRAERQEMEKKIVHLNCPFIKVQDVSPSFRPEYKEFNNGQKLYLGKFWGNSLFHKGTPEMQNKRVLEIEQDRLYKERLDAMQVDGDDGYLAVTLPPAKARIVKEVLQGFCEVCSKHANNLKEHVDSPAHQSVINAPGFYDEVDCLLGSYVEEINCPGIPLLKREEPEVKPEKSINQFESVDDQFKLY